MNNFGYMMSLNWTKYFPNFGSKYVQLMVITTRLAVSKICDMLLAGAFKNVDMNLI